MKLAVAATPLRPLTRLFKALADGTRLRIVALLSHGELCVCHLEAGLGLTQSNASRHLAVLRAAEIVEPRRDGSWVYYRLAPQADGECRRVLRALVGEFEKRDLLRRDVARLLKVRGPGACR
jgi:ArsR family transcriptional regulator, arsenate/arsenite/antimonite-responsive transcriptional repressor